MCSGSRSVRDSDACWFTEAVTLQRCGAGADEIGMGLEDRDWYRDEPQRTSPRVPLPVGILIVVGLVVGLGLAGAIRWKTQAPAATFGAERQTHHGPAEISFFPGLPDVKIGGDGLYEKDDPWREFLADEKTCPGGEDTDAPLARQANTMVCLVNYAREKRGLGPVATMDVLNASSVAKVERIVRCLDFNHDACGEDAAQEIRALGYRGAWGENLYIGGGPYGAPRPALDGWLNSPGHRENLFMTGWTTEGIAVRKVERFGRDRNMTLWVNQFGTR